MGLIRRIRPEKTGLRAPLGDLELSVMRHVWACGENGCVAVEVQQTLGRERSIALTTVLTTLDRLHTKGILVREREGKAYRYRAAFSEQQLQERIVAGVLSDLIAQFPKAVASYFAQHGDHAEESERLAELAQRMEDASASFGQGEETDGA